MPQHDPNPSEEKRADLRRAALDYHEFPIPGKLATQATKQMVNQHDLSLAYSPGVAAPCEEIVADPAAVDRLLTEYEGDAGRPPLAAHQDEIDKIFGADTLEEILAGLKSAGTEWASEQLKVLATKSPQTMKVALRQLRLGGKMESFAENMTMEYRIGARVVQRHDFIEGVRAVIVDKDNSPRWNPPTPEGVSEAMLDEIFAPLPSDQEWSPLA